MDLSTDYLYFFTLCPVNNQRGNGQKEDEICRLT